MTAVLRPMSLGERVVCAGMVAFVFFAYITAAAQTVKVPEPESTTRWRDVSIEDYRQHLIALESLVESCAKARDVKSCDPALAGPDDRIPITVGRAAQLRLIRYGWLRAVLVKAGGPDEKAAAKPEGTKDSNKKHSATIANQPATSQLLKDAKERLERDLAQSRAPSSPVPDYQREQAVMREVLAGKEFRSLQQASVRDSILEKVGNWLNRFFASVGNLKAHSAWVGRVIVWGFILGVCTALVYSLLRLERHWRVKLTPDDDQRHSAGAASARDWQLWLEDARRAAASGKWREAVHFVYWAAISRLESRRLWPADRARTPREYLALVAEGDSRRTGLSQLTGTFERFWYGGRKAGESDYRAAESLAMTLINGGTAGGDTTGESVQEGGAR